MRLWENLATMLPERSTLDRLTAMRRREWQRLDGEARREIADFLLDAAAFRQEVDENEDTATVLQTMQAEIRQLERQMQQRLFALYRFYHSEIDGGDWMPQAFRQDPFDSELLKQYGIRTGTGAATGALIGLGLDIATLGGSLGLGTAIGGFLGGILPNTRTISDKLAGRQTLHTDPETLTLLAARALDLLHVLQTRGHAAQSDIELHSRKAPWDAAKLPPELNKARSHWKWSSLNTHRPETSRAERREYAEKIGIRLAGK
ncbi:integral membrane protein [Neisseria gonorrhoeae]|uniref:Integral membrane protein n=1 Tax=Neisseria gonorrhoeae TaxID=485 RepID=A0A379B2V6_NEIGO|nr:integral membrane protein [Neisseria gonorrhoeae]